MMFPFKYHWRLTNPEGYAFRVTEPPEQKVVLPEEVIDALGAVFTDTIIWFDNAVPQEQDTWH